jgi:competence protein ComEC
MRSIVTRFRAYQLGAAGSSFSYYADSKFTVIEGRLTEQSKVNLFREMALCGVARASALHITSWDSDHCSAAELPDLLALARPTTIECPGYQAHTDCGQECSKSIEDYRATRNWPVTVRRITPEYVNNLKTADALAFNDVLYNPKHIDADCANNNSTVQFFRGGSFNVLSLGDVESSLISARLRRDSYLCRETDVMILAHHGADNGFTTKPFLSGVNPQLAICSSNYDNQYDHPCDVIRDLLHEQRVRLMTTKTGDVVVYSIGGHAGWFRAVNLKADSTEISSSCDFYSRKARLLSFNDDTIRQLYAPKRSYPPG